MDNQFTIGSPFFIDTVRVPELSTVDVAHVNILAYVEFRRNNRKKVKTHSTTTVFAEKPEVVIAQEFVPDELPR
jgi:hypothetical protein